MGCATGAVDAYRRLGTSSQGSVVAASLGGGVMAALSYGAFVVAGLVLSLMMFSSAPDPVPALLCVLLGCAAFLIVRWVQSVFADRFGMRTPRSSDRRSINDVL